MREEREKRDQRKRTYHVVRERRGERRQISGRGEKQKGTSYPQKRERKKIRERNKDTKSRGGGREKVKNVKVKKMEETKW